MALFPCDVTGHRYRGQQRAMYPAVVEGQNAVRRKLRLCQAHFDGFLDQLSENAHNAQMAFDDPATSSCYLCGGEVTGSEAQLFVTVYDLRAEREDWWAALHRQCVSGTLEDWHLGSSIDS